MEAMKLKVKKLISFLVFVSYNITLKTTTFSFLGKQEILNNPFKKNLINERRWRYLNNSFKKLITERRWRYLNNPFKKLFTERRWRYLNNPFKKRITEHRWRYLHSQHVQTAFSLHSHCSYQSRSSHSSFFSP